MSTPLGRNPARPAEPVEKKGVAHPKPAAAEASRKESTSATKTETLTAVPAEPEAVPARPWIVSMGVALWQLRLSLGAGLVSAAVHMVLIITLAMMVGPAWNDRTVIPPADLEATIVKPTTVPREMPKLVEEIKLNVPPSVKSISPQNLAARGKGSSGAGGGSGGGFALGFVAVGSERGNEVAVSGGTGSGIDSAYGADMLGEVGILGDDKATFFGVEAKGRNFVFVVDTSGSMRHNQRYRRCQDELLRSVTSMQYGQQYFIVFFSDKLYPMPENKLVYAKPDQLQKTAQWLVNAVPDGGTEPWPGLQRAFRMAPDAIFLLTDGQFDPEVVKKCARIQPETKKKIPIHTIAFESQQGAVLLEAIAKQSGGTFRFVP